LLVYVTAGVFSVRPASNTGELARTTLKHSDLSFRNSLYLFTMSLVQTVKTECATKSECAVHIEHPLPR